MVFLFINGVSILDSCWSSSTAPASNESQSKASFQACSKTSPKACPQANFPEPSAGSSSSTGPSSGTSTGS